MRTLAADGLTLEPQVAAHAAELFPLLADTALYVFTDDKEPPSEDWLRDRFARLESRQSPDGSQLWLNWVVRTDDGAAAGYVQATVEDGEAEIAYVLGRQFWRLGYGYAACLAMLEELAAAYAVSRVTATLDAANAASVALLTKLGLRQVREDRAAHEVTFAGAIGVRAAGLAKP